MRFWRRTKGTISIFLVIILVPMMTVSSLFVDAGKVKLARGVAESAGDLTLNTALTDYDIMLKDLYGLFATSQDTEELFAKLEDYYRTCITSSGVGSEDADAYVDQIMAQLGLVAEGDETSDILNMELVDFDITKRSDTSLANATLLKKQIIEFMKYRAPINTGLSFITALDSFSTLSQQTELVDKRQKYYEVQAYVMEEARAAWGYINDYNKSGFVQDNSYFAAMKNKFDNNYGASYKRISEKIIKDLYDTQNYDGFTYYAYQLVKENDVPVFYLNSDRTQKKNDYTEYTVYSDEKRPTASQFKNALNSYNTAYSEVQKNWKALESLGSIDGNTYGLQYLVQTNRGNFYKKWIDSMVSLYNSYSMLRHAGEYADEAVMNTSGKLSGESVSRTYSYYYDKFMRSFDAMASEGTEENFNARRSKYSSALQNYANSANTDPTGTQREVAELYAQIIGYRQTVENAKNNLGKAVEHLNNVYGEIKEDGNLKIAERNWKKAAEDKDLAGTSMAKQDLAEISSLSTYLIPEEVDKLIQRLNCIKGNLESMLSQIDSYTFWDKKITEISDYNTLVNLLKQKIGDGELKSLPTDKTELQKKVDGWLNGKYTAGGLDISWDSSQGCQANLTKDKLNFYSYLYTHFNTGNTLEGETVGTELKQENKENGKYFYEEFKTSTSNKTAGDANKADESNIENGNELSSLEGRPSQNTGGGIGSGGESEFPTGDDAAAEVSGSLGSMFESLTSALIGMGTDLRDKLYVSDYILSMFSYDTVKKEYEVKNPGKEANPQSLTLLPFNEENNFAYGKEVEYIIYGGKNADNISKAYGSIYAIRLGFNLIYAFSASEIRDTALAIATPVSAASLGVLPVPLIQAAIIIGVACCESAIDLTDLKNGESVPLFKNNRTWKLSIKQVITDVKAEVGNALNDLTESAIDTGLEELNSLLDMTDDELTGFIQNGTVNVINAVDESFDTLIARHANTAIQKLTTLCNNVIEENMLSPVENMAKKVSDGLDAWLAEEAVGVDTSSDLSYIVKEEAVKIIKSEFIEDTLDELAKNVEAVQGSIASSANAITEILTDLRDEITRQVSTLSQPILDYKDQMMQKIEASMTGGAESLKNTLHTQINGIFGSSDGGSKTDETGMASLLSFSYSDYLRLFLLIGLYSDEEGVVLRTGDVIQANMSMATGNEGYRLKNSAAYVELSAAIQVKPTLLALPLFADVEGNPSGDQRWYTIEYKSIKGY